MFRFPFTNFHELNLDWILSVVKEAKEVFDSGREDIDYAVETADEAKTIATQAAEAVVPDNSVSTAKLQDRAVTGDKIAENTITNYNIQNGTIITADLADSIINTSKLADDAVTWAKLADNAKPLISLADKYIRFPNGVVLQWGRVSSIEFDNQVAVTGSFNFQYPFAGASTCFFVGAQIPETSSPDYVFSVGVSATSGSEAAWIMRHDAGTPISILNRQFDWIAIGM